MLINHFIRMHLKRPYNPHGLNNKDVSTFERCVVVLDETRTTSRKIFQQFFFSSTDSTVQNSTISFYCCCQRTRIENGKFLLNLYLKLHPDALTNQ